jgi:putative endonuclease
MTSSRFSRPKSRHRRPDPTGAPRNEAERRAARWYRWRGYRILDTNRWLAGYEIDVVARRGRCVVFCEVKSKSGEEFGDPLEMVTPEKARRVRRAAEAWLVRHPEHDGLEVRFDVLADRAGRLEHLPGAF